MYLFPAYYNNYIFRQQRVHAVIIDVLTISIKRYSLHALFDTLTKGTKEYTPTLFAAPMGRKECSYPRTLSLIPRPHHAREERVWGHWRSFLGRAHHHVTARAPIQTYANNHMIAELAEPRISANVPRPFPPFWGWGLGTRLPHSLLSE